MSEPTKITVLAPFRCGGKLVKEKTTLEVDKQISKKDAKAMVANGLARWVQSKAKKEGDE